MSLAVVTLKKGEGRLLKSGGMWIFDNEIATIMGSFVNGDIVLIHDFDGYPLGKGFINTNSKITVRLLTRDENQKIDEEFLEKRVRDAWEYRKKVTDTSSCRLIFGEADFLPGLVVDKFEDVLVVQSLALGIDRLKNTILELSKKFWQKTESRFAVFMKEVMQRSANRKEWNCIKALSDRNFLHWLKLWKMV